MNTFFKIKEFGKIIVLAFVTLDKVMQAVVGLDKDTFFYTENSQGEMVKRVSKLDDGVTKFINDLNHPMQKEIHYLRELIMAANVGLTENIKWNGPNFCLEGDDRITMKIQPPNQIQLIFHRGAKVIKQLKTKLIDDDSGLLFWKANDRAVASFKNMQDITSNKGALNKVINEWLKAAAK